MHIRSRQASIAPSHDEASRSLARPVPSKYSLDQSLLKLQQTIGNQSVQRLVHSQPVQGLRPSQGGLLQRKCACGGTPGLDGECAECRQKRLRRQLHPTSQPEAAAVPPIVHEVLRSPGQPLDTNTRACMELRFGHDFSQVRVHTDSRAAESARAVNAAAYTVGANIAFDTERFIPATVGGKRLLAHELAHVVQQQDAAGSQNQWIVSRSDHPLEREADSVAAQVSRDRAVTHQQLLTGTSSQIVQRDLALEPPVVVPEQPELTDAQAQAAIRYNRASYGVDSTRLIQDLVGVEQTGTFDEATVRAIARIQRDFGLQADGKAGADTYNLLIRELQAEDAAPETCLSLFQIVGPEPLRFFRSTTNPNQGTIGSRFFIKARFDPRCNCEEFEYRQYIAGSVDLHDVAGPTFNLNSYFIVPGGLSSTLKEDGDTSIPAGVAGHHYGHRRHADNPGDDRDRYLPDRSTGCEYAGHDYPELGPLPAAAGDSGDRYEWTMRFRGVITRSGHGVVEEKYWAIQDTVVIP
jgi:peptidoglycan hydrolase-like protein with peptidoglycan-binding domain